MKNGSGKNLPLRNRFGFTLVEIIIVIAILGILATISILNGRTYLARAEYAAMLTNLKHLMDGEDFYFLDNNTFFPSRGNVNIPKGTAREIPELAYDFPAGHKNRYRIRGTNNANRNFYRIDVWCDFDLNNDGRDDRFTAITDIRRGNVLINREVTKIR